MRLKQLLRIALHLFKNFSRILHRKMIAKKVKTIGLISLGGFATFSTIAALKYDEMTYKTCILPIFQLFDPEKVHDLVLNVLKHDRIVPEIIMQNDPILESEFFGKKLRNPFGLSAGFDKNGKAVKGFAKFGFSYIEIGSVTKYPQPGNLKPRIFRYENDLAIINSCGFNSDGFETVYANLKQIRTNEFPKLIGVNLGVNKNSLNPIDDYVSGIDKFQDVADYFVINISSPNTAGLRDLHQIDKLKDLLKTVNKTRNRLTTKTASIPLFLKLSPNLSFDHLKEIAVTITKDAECKVDGVIISNTSNNPEDLNKFGQSAGGLSGKPLFDISTKMLSDMYKLTKGQVYLIASGGIFNGEDAFKKIVSGANLVEIYSGLVFEGPTVVRKCESELIAILKKNGYENVRDAVGSRVQ